MKRVPINIAEYPEFYYQVLNLPKPNNGFISKRRFRENLKQYFGLDAHNRLATGLKIIYLLPDDAVAFRLKYRQW